MEKEESEQERKKREKEEIEKGLVLKIKFDEKGLVPVVVQEDRTGMVLMVAWANEKRLLKRDMPLFLAGQDKNYG